MFTTADENGNLLGRSARFLHSRKTKSRWKIFSRNSKRWANNNPASVVHRGRSRDRFIILAVRFQLTCRPHVRSPIPSFLPVSFLLRRTCPNTTKTRDGPIRPRSSPINDRALLQRFSSDQPFHLPLVPRPDNFLINDRGQPPRISPLTRFDPHAAPSQVN